VTGPRVRLERLTGRHECQRCHGTGVEPALAPAPRGSSPVRQLVADLDDIARRRREYADGVAPHERTAGQWAALDPDRVSGALVASVLDHLAEVRDPAFEDVCRAYLAALDRRDGTLP